MPSFLVVDDSPTIRLTMAAALRQVYEGLSIQVVEAPSERAAIDEFLQGKFDVVFLDMMLTEKRSSLDVLRAILAAKLDAKVIITTGLDREHPDVVEAISIGAFSHLRKPVRVSDVRTAIDEVTAESGRSGRIR